METALLVWETQEKDKDGFPVPVRNETEVYAKEKSVTRQEKYLAMNSGVDVKTTLEVRQEDWEQTRHIVDKKPEYARKAIFDGCEYDIIRTYKAGKATIEIVCG